MSHVIQQEREALQERGRQREEAAKDAGTLPPFTLPEPGAEATMPPHRVSLPALPPEGATVMSRTLQELRTGAEALLPALATLEGFLSGGSRDVDLLQQHVRAVQVAAGSIARAQADLSGQLLLEISLRDVSAARSMRVADEQRQRETQQAAAHATEAAEARRIRGLLARHPE